MFQKRHGKKLVVAVLVLPLLAYVGPGLFIGHGELAGEAAGVEGRGWMMFSGVLSALLGLMLVAKWPISAAWAVGTFVGIHIIMRGWARVFIGVAARSLDD